MKIKINFAIHFLLILNFSSFCGDADFSASSRAKTLSLNGLYFAGQDGLQSVLTNPSQLSLLNSKALEVYVLDKSSQYEFKNVFNSYFKSFPDDDFSLGAGLFWNFSETITAAVSYQRAYDYKVSWPFANLFVDSSGPSLLAFDMFNRISADAASASASVRINKFLIGASWHFYFVEQHTSFPRSNERWSRGLGQAAYQINYNQDGTAIGFNIGISYLASERLTIGVIARSAYKVDLEGNADSRMFAELDAAPSAVSISGTLEMPWIFGGGAIYNISQKLKLNIDFQYSLWDGVNKSIDFSFDDPVWKQNLSSADPFTGIDAESFLLSFNNTIDAGLGIEYEMADIVLRGGYRFSQSPNSAGTYNMLFPAVDRHIISAGMEYRMEKLTADLGFAYSFGTSKNITAGSSLLTGKYSSSAYMPSLTLKYGF